MKRIANAPSETVTEEIEVTPEMIAAGARELKLFDINYDDERDAAVRIFTAMLRARLTT